MRVGYLRKVTQFWHDLIVRYSDKSRQYLQTRCERLY
jgi:hypothetical protein